MRSKFKWIFTLLVALTMQLSFAQEKTVKGVVTDANGPMPGVNVLVKGTQRGVSTGFDGAYSIKASQGEVLVFSFMGMGDVSRTVGASASISVKMQDDAKQLGEVVVVGYAKQEKKKMIQSVSVVGASKIRDTPIASFADALQGQASGVQVVNSSGVLGSVPVVKIRGVASISANGRPLIVMDGVPLNDALLTSTQGGQSLDPLVDINQNDIESFSVLKDAAATAIYGSRGSNGVILITTKSGKKNQEAKVEVGFTTSMTTATDVMSMMTADQYRAFVIKTNPASNFTNEDVGLGSFNWIDAVSRKGISTGVDVSVSGGSDKTTYSLSGNISDQQGFIIGNGLKKNGFRLNLATDVKDWLRVGTTIGVSESKMDRVGSENSVAAPFTAAYLQAPNISPYGEDGKFQRTGFVSNVVAIEALNINDANSFRVNGNVFADLRLHKNLNFKTEFGIDRSSLDEFQRQFEINTAGGFARSYQAVQQKFVNTNTLNYKKTFALKHNFNILGGLSVENTGIRDVTTEGTGFASDDLINVTSALNKTTTDNKTTGSRLVGLFSRLSYDFSGKYLVELSARRDGSSRFGSDFRYGNFGAVGVAWVVSEEDFLKESKLVSNFKLKANYGIAGNDRIGDYLARERTEGGVFPNYNEATGIYTLRFANPNMKWEQSKSYDLGLELGMFNNKFRVNVDYYNKTTNQLILRSNFSVADNNGIVGLTGNAGSMENKGFDLDVALDVFRESKFKWTSSFNFNNNKNTILELNDAAATDLDGNKFISGGRSQRAIVGHSVNTFFLIRYSGVNTQTGNAEWLDRNGNATTTPKADDRVIVGDANPDFTGGFNNNFKYGNWDLNALINFSYGNKIMVDGLGFTEDARYSNGFNKSSDLLNIWEKPGDNASTPNITSPTFRTFQQRSTKQLRDASFARLKGVTLGYNLVFDKSSSFAKLVKSVRLYATAQNLYTLKNDNLRGIDPEVTNTTESLGQGETFFTPPQTKTFVFGARLTF
ncbi:SusC/RagA family TonB-linked outer membrane protein [Flavobacterium psychrophilum]|uniref:SusC/RagA family TonB-linked outer membrane protein n=1 Tax=Flavobacterium psychrophilum TaxID=96345 RepID=A0A7U2NEK5_FLAPS|nr:SusC/RagA family TonB-linked outer membrane protein [Flavobacterium psychrophilum]EKT3957783.1 SusC/RagA family TonB-linked outer membrane protein [Flavobacterium psychrophilum]EKT4509979.1 SusC/RagA family TonB-linked outer membrane protein [Flavobacterium psychrophilum]MCB6088284.1 SusC/RagA family TonB-linked outer membrane protein [Flavobacterium psychrophilum]OAE91704.1 hypothetical protein SU65_07940 [Flavobacterium psychrophilum]QRE03745.1 SusC/RagA family TonB-linked outer membrane 